MGLTFFDIKVLCYLQKCKFFLLLIHSLLFTFVLCLLGRLTRKVFLNGPTPPSPRAWPCHLVLLLFCTLSWFIYFFDSGLTWIGLAHSGFRVLICVLFGKEGGTILYSLLSPLPHSQATETLDSYICSTSKYPGSGF